MKGGYPNFIGLLIGLPMTGRALPPEWAFGFHSLVPPMNYHILVARTVGWDVDKARNHLAEQAVEQGCKYLFFLGEDVVPPAHALRQLIFQMEHHPEAGVIGGIYCHKADPPMPMVFRGNGAGPYWDWKVGEFFEVSGLGMDATLIRVEALKTLEKPWFKTVDDISHILDGVNHADAWTEDLYFCNRIVEAGWRVYAEGSLLCDHYNMQTLKPVRLPSNSLPTRRMSADLGQKRIVDLGCGEAPLETDEGEVVKVDIREEVSPDYRCDLRWLPFGTGEFDIAFSSHTLEHFSRDEVDAVLDEWVRILKPDGELRLIIPNIAWSAERILKGVLDADDADPQKVDSEAWHTMNVLYGAQSYAENFHKTCFTPKSLERMLKARGFKRLDFTLEGYNISVRAWRVPPVPIESTIEEVIEAT